MLFLPWIPLQLIFFTAALSIQNLPSYLNGKIGSNERVVFFPSLASQANSTHWNVPIHGWIFKPETESTRRAAFLRVLGRAFNVNDADQKLILQRRVRPFVVDNQSMKRPKIEFFSDEGTPTYHRARSFSRKNGHFRCSLALSNRQLGVFNQTESEHVDHSIATFRAKTSDFDPRTFPASVHLIPPTGVSIISDIDDTIKLTNVLDKKDFIQNTFLKEFKVVPGMVKVFQQWRSQFENCAFHFVSASPYQLYEELSDFTTDVGFPPASFHLKTIRPKDKSILKLFADPLVYKRNQIKLILREFPKRTFILVGDSGEKDPEVYANIYKDYAPQIRAIYIRNLNNATAARMEGVPNDRWSFFSDGKDLMHIMEQSNSIAQD